MLDGSLFGGKVIVTKTLDGVNPTDKYKPAFLCAGCCTNSPWQEGSNMEALLTTGLQVLFTEIASTNNYQSNWCTSTIYSNLCMISNN